MFRALQSTDIAESGALHPGIALGLMDARAGVRTFAYRPESTSFVEVDRSVVPKSYAAGLTCWAGDLLAAFHGQLSPSALIMGRCRYWHDGNTRISILPELWKYLHPLRRPIGWRRLYGSIVEQRSGAVKVHGSGDVVKISNGYW